MPYARVHDIDIWYERSGGSGPTLVLTHGFAGPTADWGPIIEAFRAHFDLVLYDVRGHHRSVLPEGAPCSVPQFAADLAGLMDALGIEQAHVGGVSMGGMISAQFACDFPGKTRSLLLCDTTAGNRQGPSAEANQAEQMLVQAFEQMAHIAEKYGMEGLAERENAYRRQGDRYAHLQVFTLEQQDARNLSMKEHMTAAGYVAVNRALRERPDLTARTPSIAAPALVSCGEWDMFYPCAVRDHALIPNSRLVTIRGSAHATPDYQPGLWRQTVFDFIDDVEAGRDVRGERTLSGAEQTTDNRQQTTA